jgi:hypothetical protein
LLFSSSTAAASDIQFLDHLIEQNVSGHTQIKAGIDHQVDVMQGG